MAGYKQNKQVKQREKPTGKFVAQGGCPEQYYREKPSWNFMSADQKMWAFNQNHVGNLFWTEILPCLSSLESQTWGDILVRDKKKNHSINTCDLNKTAQDRLIAKYIEAESLISLHLTGKHRLYGYMIGNVFNILWFDDDHGDNSRCVCRSYLKHT